ncbi:MAG TPA: sulfatase-like hydrolase/transferase [Thermoanaerobaculia bacterium]|nr:sulfatase-like hydrolase/transferase [Thermoanaerobaculia bacterium]
MNQRSNLIAAILLVMTGCGGGELPPPSATSPVIIISIDTLRSDRLPAYGYERNSTPHIDALAADSLLFEHAYTHAPLTLPAHASLFTGLLPADHGVRDNIGFRVRDDVPTLAEMMRDRGYATGAAVSAYVLRKETGIARGFEFYDDAVQQSPEHALGMMERSGQATADSALAWIDRTQKPFFLFLHLFEPHAPYDPPEPFRALHRDRYDGEVAWTDRIVGRFLDGLRSRNLYDDSIIIFLSDHGEGLGDHGESEHGLLLYRETVQVPLIVKLPGRRSGGTRVVHPVQIVDIVPTIAELTGASPPPSLAGRSLLGAAGDARRPIVAETFYPRFNLGWSELYSLIEGPHHYIEGRRGELFDLQDDPAETKNLLTEERKKVASMRAALARFKREPESPGAVGAEERAGLAALGYLGGGSAATGDLPDPRDRMESYRAMQSAFSLYRAGRHEESLQAAERLLRQEPRVVDVWDLKARLLSSLGRPAEAVEAGKKALALAPDRLDVAALVTNLLVESGSHDEAAEHAEFIARRSSTESRERAAVLLVMARVEQERGNPDAALALLDQAIAAKSPAKKLPGLLAARGDVLARTGRFEEAERDLRAEIAAFPEEPDAYRSLIILLVASERLQEATATVRELIETAPRPPSYIAVCEALEAVGDRRGVRYWARRGLERFPADPALKRFASS